MTPALFSLAFNLAYALFHGIWGIAQRSIWLLILGAYYAVWAATRFAVVLCSRQRRRCAFVLSICGGLMIALSAVLSSITYLSLSENIATRYGTIVMITIATYVTIKVTMALRRAWQRGKDQSSIHITLRCISYADVSVSVMTMQRSMLASFGDASDRGALILNILTSTAVWLFVLSLGIFMIRKGMQNVKQQIHQGQ